jgi:hypothetical protein
MSRRARLRSSRSGNHQVICCSHARVYWYVAKYRRLQIPFLEVSRIRELHLEDAFHNIHSPDIDVGLH